MADDEDPRIDVQSITFRPGETDTLVEITYSERRDQTRGIALYKVLMFEARRSTQMVSDILESAEDLVDEILMQKQDLPDRKPGRNV